MDRTPISAVYAFGDFTLDVQRQQLSQGCGGPVTLPARAFELLVHLVVHAGELMEKAALMQALWPNVVVEENNLSQHLSTLRRALGDGQEGHRYIVTVPGRGYRFVAPVRRADAPATEAPPAPLASVAVLPFANLSGDPTIEYFGDGMAEELIHLLSRVPGLKVPARTSSFAYKGRSLHVRTIARDLGVRTILEGSVRSAGERIRITAQLVSAETGYHLWSESFDRQFGDIFALQDEIAGAIVQSLRGQMGAALQPVAPPSPPTRDLQAYQLYLQGISMGQRAGEPQMMRGLKFLEDAIARDPQFARAWAALAAVRVALIFYGNPESAARARSEAERALAIDPGVAEAHSVFGIVHVIRRAWLEADASFRAFAPGDPGAPSYLFGLYLLASAGHVRTTVAIVRREHEAAPAVPVTLAVLAAAHVALPLRDEATLEALRYAELAVDMGTPRNAGPLPAIFSYTALRLGRKEDAAQAAELYVTRLRPVLRAAGAAEVIRQVHAHLADPTSTSSALPALMQLLRAVQAEHIGPEFSVHMLAWYTMMGALDAAYEFAHRVLDFAIQSDTMGIFLNWIWLPELLPFRQDARFATLVARLNLMAYWARYGPPDDCQLQDGRLIVG